MYNKKNRVLACFQTRPETIVIGYLSYFLLAVICSRLPAGGNNNAEALLVIS